MKDWENKVAIITGGTGALGKAVTRAFLDAVANAVVIYNTETRRAELLNSHGALIPVYVPG